MKKLNIILGIACMAFMASCGNATEENKNADSPAANEAAAPTEPAADPAAATPAPNAETGGTQVEVNTDNVNVTTEKAKVEAGGDGIKVEVKKP